MKHSKLFTLKENHIWEPDESCLCALFEEGPTGLLYNYQDLYLKADGVWTSLDEEITIEDAEIDWFLPITQFEDRNNYRLRPDCKNVYKIYFQKSTHGIHVMAEIERYPESGIPMGGVLDEGREYNSLEEAEKFAENFVQFKPRSEKDKYRFVIECGKVREADKSWKF